MQLCINCFFVLLFAMLFIFKTQSLHEMLFATQFIYFWVKEDSQWENNRMGLDFIHWERIRLKNWCFLPIEPFFQIVFKE